LRCDLGLDFCFLVLQLLLVFGGQNPAMHLVVRGLELRIDAQFHADGDARDLGVFRRFERYRIHPRFIRLEVKRLFRYLGRLPHTGKQLIHHAGGQNLRFGLIPGEARVLIGQPHDLAERHQGAGQDRQRENDLQQCESITLNRDRPGE
jgi:hypothetical protein